MVVWCGCGEGVGVGSFIGAAGLFLRLGILEMKGVVDGGDVAVWL